jgi:hypothetical protein
MSSRENVPALISATMFPQVASLMTSLAPPVMAGAISQKLHLRPELAASYIGIVYGGVFVGNLFGPGLISPYGPLRLSLWCVAGNGVYLAALMNEVEPSTAAMATSGGLTFNYLGIFVGPSIFSGIAIVSGFAPALLLLALLAVGGALLLAGRHVEDRRAPWRG